MAESVEYVKTKRCWVCRREGQVFVPSDGYVKWKEGGLLIQDAMPDVRPEVREQLMTGLHPECWDSIFEGDDGEGW